MGIPSFQTVLPELETTTALTLETDKALRNIKIQKHTSTCDSAYDIDNKQCVRLEWHRY